MKTATYLTLGLFVLAAVAMPAMAQPDHAQDRREAAKDRIAHCQETDNATHQERCKAAKDKAKDFQKDRRAAHHLQHAIDALYKRIGKLEMHEYRIESALESGNHSANETAELEAKLERIEGAQEKAILKVRELQAKMGELRDRHEAVRDHVDAMRAKRGGDGAESDDDHAEEGEDPSSEA